MPLPHEKRGEPSPVHQSAVHRPAGTSASRRVHCGVLRTYSAVFLNFSNGAGPSRFCGPQPTTSLNGERLKV